MIFVTFEGIDGSGKSTQAERLADRLAEAGRQAVLFREPGGTELSERVRSILLDPTLRIGDLPELLLFSSARAQLVEQRIRPALKDGTIVICDRFYDSTTAYQGAGRGVSTLEWVKDFNMHVTGNLRPDRTYLLALAPDLALRRREGRASQDGLEADRMEISDQAFFRRVTDAYDRLADEEPERFLRLDGRNSVENLSEAIWSDVTTLLRKVEGTPHSG